MHRRLTLALPLLLPLLLGAPAQAGTAAADIRTDIPDVTALLRHAVAEKRLGGAAVIAVRDGRLVYEGYVGDIGPDTPVPVASVSKWASGLVLLALIGEGKLRFDSTPAEVGLTGDRVLSTMTLAQLMSHTSGIKPARPRENGRHDTLAAAAGAAMAADRLGTPGTVFAYGGTSMQLAGRMAELATGQSWSRLFQQYLAGPLDLSPSAGFGGGDNPLIGAGLRATPSDLAKILAFAAARGAAPDGRQVIPAALFDAMERNIAQGARIAYTPDTASALPGYGFGVWCEVVAAVGRCPVISSPGAFGTYPYLDRDSGLSVLIVTEGRLPRVVDDWRAIIDRLRAAGR